MKWSSSQWVLPLLSRWRVSNVYQPMPAPIPSSSPVSQCSHDRRSPAPSRGVSSGRSWSPTYASPQDLANARQKSSSARSSATMKATIAHSNAHATGAAGTPDSTAPATHATAAPITST